MFRYLIAKMFRFLPKYGHFWVLFRKLNTKKLSTHGWFQQWRCFTLNWMDYPKYHWHFWLLLWLSHKLAPKTKLSTTGKLSTIGELPFVEYFSSFMFTSSRWDFWNYKFYSLWTNFSCNYIFQRRKTTFKKDNRRYPYIFFLVEILL